MERASRLPFHDYELNRAEASNKEALHEVHALMCSDRLSELIRGDQLTLALLRPQLGPDANLFTLDDAQAAITVEEQIMGMGMLAKFSVQLDDQAVEDFYSGDPRETMLDMSPYSFPHFENKWEEYKGLMLSAPCTVILLKSDNAIDTWRSHLGNWNVDATRDISTIRGLMATNNYNDLVHGSDSTESAKREIGIIADCIARQLE